MMMMIMMMMMMMMMMSYSLFRKYETNVKNKSLQSQPGGGRPVGYLQARLQPGWRGQGVVLGATKKQRQPTDLKPLISTF